MFTRVNTINGNARILYTVKVSYTRGNSWYELDECFIGLSGLHQAINAMYKTIRDNCHGLMENGYIHKVKVERVFLCGAFEEY